MSRYQLTWDLECIFEGGSRSSSLRQLLEALSGAPALLREKVEQLSAPDTAEWLDRWHAALKLRDEMEDQLAQARAFVGCLLSQNVDDADARLLAGRVQQLRAAFEGADLLLKDRIRQMPEDAWQRLLQDERYEPIAFQLQEERDEVAELLPPDQETLIVDLSVDGFRAWERMYYTVVGRIRVPWRANGQEELLSVGQAYNRFSDPDPGVRARHFESWTEAWAGQAELCAAALNHLSGFRLATYRHRGWDSVLARALKANRMSQATLDAMWGAVEGGKGRLVAYMRRKAELLGLDGLHWRDEQAPLAAAQRPIGFDEAVDFIVEHFGRFSPLMADFARHAAENRWIEAEDRPGKDPGGYCTRLPISRQSRIFMTFGGNTWGVSTLAHELGHAFHNHMQWDLPPMARGFTMSTAETASTFAELVVSRAARAEASGREERLALLDEALREAVTMLMNIHARFLFEQRFYEARQRGLLSVDQLNGMMEDAQREAYRGSLTGYFPYFWASKGHFYGSGTPFYNFPYTFGYLLSAGIYARAQEEGPGFERHCVDLLRDTGRMPTEELVRRHLGADLTKPDFWERAVSLVVADVDEFEKVLGNGE